MIVKILIEHHLEFLSLKGGCRGSYDSTHVKMPHCSKSHALAHMDFIIIFLVSVQQYGSRITVYIVNAIAIWHIEIVIVL